LDSLALVRKGDGQMTAAPVGAYSEPDAGPSMVIPADREQPRIIDSETGEKLSFGDVVADRLTREIGSWRFIGIYLVLLLVWMGVNTIAWVRHWDPYPFIFLNLVLSFQGAFAAPVILMSQNRQEERDRLEEQRDHAINMRAEREVAGIQARLEDLGRASLEAITSLREEQAATNEKLDAILAAQTERNAAETGRLTTERKATGTSNA
jgi:uncharacterized membrane protein